MVGVSAYRSSTTRFLGIVGTGLILTACTAAEFQSIHRSHDLNDGHSALIDAKQRIVLSKKYKKPPEQVVCAEPSPDVAQSVSTVISAAFETSTKTSDGSSGSISADAAARLGESVAQLGERLAVIQLIRDKMYRACEAYANGAIDKSAYTLLLARLDKTMVTMLSQEMVAGAFGRNLAAASASPASGASAKAIIEARDKAIAKVSDASPTKDDAIKNIREVADLALQSGGGQNAFAPYIGKIDGRQSVDNNAAQTIAAIYRDYMDDDGTEPMIDACLTQMSQVKPSAETRQSLGKIFINLATIDQLTEGTAPITAALKLKAGKPAEETFDENSIEKFNQLIPELIPGSGIDLTAQDIVRIEGSVKEKREELIDQIFEALLGEGDMFSAYCVKRILETEGGSIVERRLKQEKELRSVGVTSDKIAALENKITEHTAAHEKNARANQKLMFCSLVLADDKLRELLAGKDAKGKEFLDSCMKGDS